MYHILHTDQIWVRKMAAPEKWPRRVLLHPVSVRRFPSFRTQPLENLSVDSVTNDFLSNPDPGENLLSGNLVMETGCRLFKLCVIL